MKLRYLLGAVIAFSSLHTEASFASNNENLLEEVNRRGEIGITPLIRAALHSRTDEASDLLARGAVVDMEDDSGCTALSYAIMRGNIQLVNLLLQNGANIEHQNPLNQHTPLRLAIISEQKEIIELLLSNHASLDQKSLDLGETVVDFSQRVAPNDIAELVDAYDGGQRTKSAK